MYFDGPQVDILARSAALIITHISVLANSLFPTAEMHQIGPTLALNRIRGPLPCDNHREYRSLR